MDKPKQQSLSKLMFINVTRTKSLNLSSPTTPLPIKTIPITISLAYASGFPTSYLVNHVGGASYCSEAASNDCLKECTMHLQASLACHQCSLAVLKGTIVKLMALTYHPLMNCLHPSFRHITYFCGVCLEKLNYLWISRCLNHLYTHVCKLNFSIDFDINFKKGIQGR